MIEWALGGIARLLVWLWTSATTLYYLSGFVVVVGGMIIFLGTVAHHFWKLSLESKATSGSETSSVTVHVHNLNVTVDMTEGQLRRLLASHELGLPRAADDIDATDEHP